MSTVYNQAAGVENTEKKTPVHRVSCVKCCPLVGNVLLTHCMQEVIVMCEGHKWIWQLSQPLLHQARHCVDGIVF